MFSIAIKKMGSVVTGIHNKQKQVLAMSATTMVAMTTIQYCSAHTGK